MACSSLFILKPPQNYMYTAELSLGVYNHHFVPNESIKMINNVIGSLFYLFLMTAKLVIRIFKLYTIYKIAPRDLILWDMAQ